ncbi:MAG: AMP-binding protein [Pseudomonadota bacterium]
MALAALDGPVERVLPDAPSWEAMRAAFRWPTPEHYNIVEEACDRWARADPARLALTDVAADGRAREWAYGDLARSSARLAQALAAHGLSIGDRCAVLLPQSAEVVLTHFACYRLGAIVVPLFTLFGAEALRYRLADAGVRVVVTDAENLAKIAEVRPDLPMLETVFSVDGPGPEALGFWQELERGRDALAARATHPDDPAFLSYTSGTTGPPKGALHAHRVLLGHLPGVESHHDGFPQPGDRMWTPADWAWMGGLANIMLPALTYGVPLVAHRMGKFDPERAFDLIARLGIRNAFLPPTALKLMRQSGARPRGASLRSVGSGGEALGAGLLEWGEEVLGLTINEFYGQTECNLVLGNWSGRLPVRPGATGKPVPGHDVAVVDAEGTPVPDGEEGEIAVRAPDPAMFLRYWNLPEKTAEKFAGPWMRTGDLGRRDADGYFHFAARSDDVITSSGYRIGPVEIEDCLTGHPDVAMAAVVGLPDPVRTEAIAAFVVPRPGADHGALPELLTSHVRARLSPHLAPRSVTLVEALPMTATGKIMRRALKDAGA